jgi:hypothetical protein
MVQGLCPIANRHLYAKKGPHEGRTESIGHGDITKTAISIT